MSGGALIVPTMRPEKAAWLRATVERQEVRPPVVVVLNGRARDWAHLYRWADVVVSGPQHKAECLELGRQASMRLGCEWYACLDDDDYYGRRYVARVAAAFDAGARWVGQRSHFMRTRDWRLWLLGDEGFVLGCCLAARCELPGWGGYPNSIGAEGAWQKAHGEPLTVLEAGDFAQLRDPEVAHVWPASDGHIAMRSGGAVDVGAWDPHLVDGRRPLPRGVAVTWEDDDMLLDPVELMRRSVLGVPSAEGKHHAVQE